MSQLEEIKARVEGHTPGPWGVHADTHEYRGGDFMQVEPKVGARTICEVTDQHKANAELIAAAPKLLAALEATLKYLDKLDRLDADMGTEPGEDNISASGVAILMRRAITEALR